MVIDLNPSIKKCHELMQVMDALKRCRASDEDILGECFQRALKCTLNLCFHYILTVKEIDFIEKCGHLRLLSAK